MPLLVRNVSANWRWLFSATSTNSPRGEIAKFLIIEEAGWKVGPLCTGKEKRKSPSYQPGIETRTM